ncbi:DUF4240 domain-containing protein [Streptomyces sp. NPDC004609]|uniref:DUF4240 domain-containing protein n=1 Tax=Streptomyces sp. NPDC004609 TaxID=3364704 RepID=UPI0036930AEA
MTEDEFWSLIDLLGGVADQRTTPALAEALEREGKARIEEFADIVTEKLNQLEREPLSGIPVRDTHDPSEAPPVPLAGDALSHLHYAVVAAGRSRFRQVQGNPEQVAAWAWDFSESDGLAEAISMAYEVTTGQPWLGPLPGFGVAEPEDPTADMATDVLWLSLALHGDGDIPAAYSEAAGTVVDMVQGDPQWITWWAGADQRDLSMEIEYTAQAERSKVAARPSARRPVRVRPSGSRSCRLYPLVRGDAVVACDPQRVLQLLGRLGRFEDVLRVMGGLQSDPRPADPL